MIKNNYHTHTIYCDGKDSPEELILKAISLGCSEIGFSGHSFTDIPDEHPFCMSLENTKKYKAEILSLKEKYKNQISVLLGVEQDYFSQCSTDDYEYVIGSVHYVYKNGYYISVDDTKELLIKGVNEVYDGDYYALAKDYFELVGNLYNKTKCDIVGHFDLITKFNEGNALFDTSDERYISCAEEALKKLMNHNLTFEINYGSVASNYRTQPYPEQRFINILKTNNEKILYSSDCHDKEKLLFGFNDNCLN